MSERVIQCRCGARLRIPAAHTEPNPVAACGGSFSSPSSSTPGSHPALSDCRPLRGLVCPRCHTPVDLAHAEVPSRDEPSAGQCARCRRGFRGAWDRNAGPDGTLCTICAKQYRPPTQELLDAAVQPPASITELIPDTDPATYAPRRSAADIRREAAVAKRRKWIGVLVFGAVSSCVLVLCLVLPVGEYMAAVFARAEDKALTDFTTPWQILLLLCRFLIAVFRYFAALYLTLLFFEALPNDRFYKNLITVGAVALLLCVMGVANVNPYLGLVVLVAQTSLVCYVYNLDLKEGVCFVILLVCLSPIVGLLWQFAIGMLAGAAAA